MKQLRGFTLVELIVTMTLIGIVSTLVAMPLLRPIQGFMDTARRAEMSEALDNALRRVAREVRNSLPNSLRQPNSNCIEFLPTLGGGRYRTVPGSGTGPFDPLDFSSADVSFDVLAGTGLSALPAGAKAVVYNLGIPGSDVYALDNAATIQTATTSKITLSAAKKFPFESPGKRFHVIGDTSVIYACIGAASSGGEGQGTLVRYSRALGTGLSALSACPTSLPTGAALLVDKVASCSFSYTPGVIQRDGILLMTLSIERSSESVRLFHETHVNNLP